MSADEEPTAFRMIKKHEGKEKTLPKGKAFERGPLEEELCDSQPLGNMRSFRREGLKRLGQGIKAALRKEARLPSGEPRGGGWNRWKESCSWWQCTFMCKVWSLEDGDPALKAAVGRWLGSMLLLLPPLPPRALDSCSEPGLSHPAFRQHSFQQAEAGMVTRWHARTTEARDASAEGGRGTARMNPGSQEGARWTGGRKESGNVHCSRRGSGLSSG